MIRYFLFFLSFVLSNQIAADTLPLFKTGHIKTFFLANTFASDSLFSQAVDTPSTNLAADMRLNFGLIKDNISLVSDYQLIASQGDSVIIANALAGSPFISGMIPDDDNRLFDLTRVISKDNNHILAHRLDRLYVNFTGTDTVARIGRQTLSWGNGLIYSPMDFFNPFDPSAIDTEYKTGDDMVYGQLLQDNGNDLQAVWVIRRDNNQDINSTVDSIAAKYHGFIGNNEFDLLIADHFNDTIVGAGGIVSLGGAIWRGDITLTRTPTQNTTSLVTSLSYSWQSFGHNTSGVVEFFYNGFGQDNNNYSPLALAGNTDLSSRLERGELFTLAQSYIAASASIELSPLWVVTPNLFINTNDHSLFAQLLSSYEIKQELQIVTALGMPIGKTGTEFGGIDSGIAGKTLSIELSVYAQLSWYF